MFKDFWDIKQKAEAETYLAFWCDYADDSGIYPFQKAPAPARIPSRGT
jgi:hypothetical protein